MSDTLFEKAMAIPWVGGEGKNGMGVNAPDARRILTIMCSEKYYGNEYIKELKSLNNDN